MGREEENPAPILFASGSSHLLSKPYYEPRIQAPTQAPSDEPFLITHRLVIVPAFSAVLSLFPFLVLPLELTSSSPPLLLLTNPHL